MTENTPTLPNRLTMGDILDVIKSASYTRLGDSTTTVCQLTLKNGYTVTGESACIDPNLFNQAIGEKVAWDNAVDKIWQLEGYLLTQRRFEAGL